jgi:hypothetical protein
VIMLIIAIVYISWLTYVAVLCLLKVSLILFYLEIFVNPLFRTTSYIVLAFILTSSLVIFFVTVFACSPVPLFWNRDIKNGTCINIQALAYAVSGFALVQDILLLILPLAFIRNLHMKRYRKIAVGFMFAIGTFGAVATLMRLPSLSTFKISIDPTWDYVAITTWSQLELCAGFICVSLPSIRILLARIIPTAVKDLVLSMVSSSKSNDNSNPNGIVHKMRGTNVYEEPNLSKTRGGFIRKLWPRSVPLSMRAGSRRLGSATSFYNDEDFTMRNLSQHEQVRREDIETAKTSKL